MLELKVEFRGDESTRVQNLMNTSKKGPTLTLSEYAVQGQKGKGGGKSGEEGETVVVVEPNEEGIDTPHLTVAVDRNFFENIERDVGVMKLQIKELTDLPSNQGLMEALQNVNCISCDKDVIMRKELDTSLFPPKPGLPPTKSMAPYLAYELDALRKQQRCMPQGRDLNQFENMMSSPKKPDKGDHICNRYCGGSHTVTTPQQRVTRMGHFIQQWGPEGLSEEHHIKGTDGQFYKGSEIRSPKDEDIPEEAFKTRPSMMVQGDILTARTHLKSARISEAEMHVTEPEGQEKPRKSSAEVAEKRGSKSTPRGSKELPSPGPRGSKEVRRSSKGSKEEAEAGGGSRRGSKGSKGSKGPEEAQTPQGEEGGSPPEEESPPPAAEAEAEEGAAEATQEQA